MTVDSIKLHIGDNKGYYITLLVATAVFYVLNCLTPVKADDFIYTFMDYSDGTRMNSLADVLRSHASHIITTNGRFADFFSQLFCGLLGKSAFNVFNAIVFALLLDTVVKLASPPKYRPLTLLALAIAFIALFFPNPGETMMWLSGSVNYLWAITFSLLLVRYLLWRYKSHTGIAEKVLIFIMAVIAGNMNEATSFCLFSGALIYFIFNRHQLNATLAVAMCGYFIGLAVIAASPAAWERLHGGSTVITNIGFLQITVQRLYITMGRSCYYLFPALAMIYGAWRWFRAGFRTGLVAAIHNLPVCVFVTSLLWMLAFGVDRSRVFSFYTVTGFIIIATAAWHYLASHPRLQPWMSAVLLIACAYPTVNAAITLNHFRQYNDGVVASIKAAPRECIVPASRFTEVSRFLMPVCYNSAGYYTYARYYDYYYNKDNVQFLPDSMLARYQRPDILAGGKAAPFVSSNNAVATTLYTFGTQDYSIVPIDSRYILNDFANATVHPVDKSGNMDAKELQRRYLHGFSTASTPVNYYHVKHHGKTYIILPHIGDDIGQIDIPLDPRSGVASISFTRTGR
jgi:hypothetical protein